MQENSLFTQSHDHIDTHISCIETPNDDQTNEYNTVFGNTIIYAFFRYYEVSLSSRFDV